MDWFSIVDTMLRWLFLLIAVTMTFFILLQEGKGGGLAALGGTKAAGVEGVTNPIRRFTVYLAGIFFSLAIILGIMHRPDKSNFAASLEKNAATIADPKAEAKPKPAEPVKIDSAKPIEKAPETKPADVKTPEPAKTGDAKPAETPKAEAPKADASKTDAPKADEPKVDAAKPADALKAEAPKVEEPKK